MKKKKKKKKELMLAAKNRERKVCFLIFFIFYFYFFYGFEMRKVTKEEKGDEVFVDLSCGHRGLDEVTRRHGSAELGSSTACVKMEYGDLKRLQFM